MILKYIMKIIIIVSLAFFNTSTTRINNTFFHKNKPITKWEYSYMLASICNNDQISVRYANVIQKYSKKYNLNSDIITRQIYKESNFKRMAASYKIINGKREYIAHGPSQIRPIMWNHLLYIIDNGRLAKYVRNKSLSDQIKYFNRIGYSVEMHCMIMRYLLDKYNGDYKLSLLAYWAGGGSYEFKYWSKKENVNKNHYVRDIYYSKSLHNKIKKMLDTENRKLYY